MQKELIFNKNLELLLNELKRKIMAEELPSCLDRETESSLIDSINEINELLKACNEMILSHEE